MKSFFHAVILSTSLVTYATAESLLPDVKAPAGLDSSQVPLFITLGFDDNRYADGVDWVCKELFANRVNHAGSGNKATFDGTPMRCDFFAIANADYEWSATPFSAPMPAERPVTAAWKRAYDAGFGVSNHTFTHNYNLYDLNYDSPKGELPPLLDEIGFGVRYLVNVAGIPHAEIYGFRTPYLANSIDGLSFKVTAELGMLYDCTMDNGVQGTNQLWAQPRFPGTMENGWIWPTYAAQNLWQVPNAIYPTTAGGIFSVKGFDSGTTNGWPTGISGAGFFEQMKWAIDYHYSRNRAPIDLGLHSDYYSEEAQNTSGTAANGFRTSLAERRSSLVMLLDYIEKSLPDARVISKTDVVRWMRRPVALKDLSRNDQFTFRTSDPSGILSGGTNVAQGGSSSASRAQQTVSVKVDDAKNWKKESFAGIRYPLSKSMSGVHSVRVRYRSDIPLELRLEQSDLAGQSYLLGLGTTGTAYKIVERPVNSDCFMQPRPTATEKPLDLSKVNAVSVVATVFDTTVSGTFECQVEFFGAGQLTSDVVAAQPLDESPSLPRCAVIKADRRALTLAIPAAGTYRVEVCGLSGRRLEARTIRVPAGRVTIPLTTAATGGKVVRISTAGWTTTLLAAGVR